MATYKDIKGVGRVTYDKDGGVNTVGTASGSYDDKTGSYKITNLKTGAISSGQGSRDDFDKAFSSTRSSGGGSSRGSSSNVQSEIERLRKAQTDAAIASLGKSRDNSLSNLSAERAKIEPLYYGKRNAASTGSQLGAKNFAEYMASRGGTSSGVSAQAELSRQGALQGNIGSLNRDEATAFTENDRQVTDVNNAYESDVASAQANAYTQYLQNMISQMNADRAFNQQNRQFDTTTGMQRDQFNRSFGLQQDQYQSGLDQFDRSFGLQQDQYNTGLEQWDKTFDAQQQQREFDEWLARQQLALSQQSAARAGSRGSSGPSISQIKYQNAQNAQQAMAYSMQGLQAMASDGKTRSEILKHINANAGDLQANGVPVQDLYKWAESNFKWDKRDGSWYDTTSEY